MSTYLCPVANALKGAFAAKLLSAGLREYRCATAHHKGYIAQAICVGYRRKSISWGNLPPCNPDMFGHGQSCYP